MAAVIVTSTHPLPTRRPAGRPVERPALQVLDGGRRAARAYARARPRPLRAGVYRRRRIGAMLAVVTLVTLGYLTVLGLGVVLAGPAGGAAVPKAGAAAVGQGSRFYVVQPGDTLWSIARSLHPSSDLRPVVDALESRAGGAALSPGQRLRVDGLGG
jgi:LysM domain